MSTNRFPSLLKQERQQRGWSQQDVAKELKTTRVTVNRWEHGIALPTLYFRGRLCALFEKRMEEFFPIDALNPSTACLPVEPAMPKMEIHTIETSTVAEGNVIHAGHRFELTGSKDHLAAHKTRGDAHSENKVDQGTLTLREMQQIDSDRRHLELQEKRLELQAKLIEQTIKVANQVINVLDSACDAAVRSLIIEELLTVLQQDYKEGKQEISLPTVQSVREALERAKTQTGPSQKRGSGSLEVDSPFQIVAVEKESQTSGVHE
jgi:transcriptional regulator with XRE-family HTH domain